MFKKDKSNVNIEDGKQKKVSFDKAIGNVSKIVVDPEERYLIERTDEIIREMFVGRNIDRYDRIRDVTNQYIFLKLIDEMQLLKKSYQEKIKDQDEQQLLENIIAYCLYEINYINKEIDIE